MGRKHNTGDNEKTVPVKANAQERCVPYGEALKVGKLLSGSYWRTANRVGFIGRDGLFRGHSFIYPMVCTCNGTLEGTSSSGRNLFGHLVAEDGEIENIMFWEVDIASDRLPPWA